MLEVAYQRIKSLIAELEGEYGAETAYPITEHLLHAMEAVRFAQRLEGAEVRW